MSFAMDVGGWLDRLRLGQYARAFAENHIDGQALSTLTAEDLKELGVASLGRRKRLLAAIAELHERERESAAAPDAAPPAEGERRQVTVLFADLAGYTELTQELGAERMHEFTGRFFELVDGLIERHGGRIDKHIGDCVMGVFGAPIAHGNDSERAVQAALAIREQVPALCDDIGRPVGVHIGVASGQVVASGTGGAGRREYAVTGDSVNLASRLTDAAGAGGILVFSMFGHTQLYFRPQSVAVADALAAAEAAHRVGHRRAELNARLAAFFGLYEMADLGPAREQVLAAQELVRRLGARRFEQACLLHLGRITMIKGRRDDARRTLLEGLAVARDTGIGFHGPNIMGALALTTDDADEGRRALADGEAVLLRGAVGHNHLRFYPDAIEAALGLGDWETVERHAQALDHYARAEPLPWASLFAARGRALAARGRGEPDETLRPTLEWLAGEADRLELALAGRALKAALERQAKPAAAFR